jgi:hypothetical protein
VVDSKFGNSWGGGCSNEPLGSYRLGYGRISGGGGGCFQVTPDLK